MGSWPRDRRWQHASFHLPLDIGKSDFGFLVHALDLLVAGSRGARGIAEVAGISGDVAETIENVADDDRTYEVGGGLHGPGVGAVALRDHPVQHHFATADMPLLAKCFAGGQRAVGAFDAVRRGEPFRPGVWIADIVVNG